MNGIQRYQTNGQPSEIGRFVEYKDISKIKAEGIREMVKDWWENGSGFESFEDFIFKHIQRLENGDE